MTGLSKCDKPTIQRQRGLATLSLLERDIYMKSHKDLDHIPMSRERLLSRELLPSSLSSLQFFSVLRS